MVPTSQADAAARARVRESKLSVLAIRPTLALDSQGDSDQCRRLPPASEGVGGKSCRVSMSGRMDHNSAADPLRAGKATPSGKAPTGDWFSWPTWSGVFNARVPAFILCGWLLLYTARPFSLGFYSDDWWVMVEAIQGTGPFSLTRLGHFVGSGTGFASHPVAGVIVFVVSSITGENPAAYQVFCALLSLLAALSLRSWLNGLLPEVGEAHPLAADLAAVVWLSVPWSVATTAWPTCTLAALPAQIFFTEGAQMMAPERGRGTRRLLLSAALLLTSYLTYEAFYFLAILLAAFYWFRDTVSGPWRHRLVITVCAVQAVSISLNRYIAQVNLGVSKKFASGWLSLAWTNLRFLPNELLSSAGSLGTAWTLLFGILVLAAISSAVALFLSSQRRRLSGAFSVIALSLSAILVLCVLYALGSYKITSSGLTSRTLTGVSWAVAVFVFGLLAVVFRAGRWAVVITAVMATLLFVVVNGVAQQSHVSALAAVWREEKTILARVPIEQIRSLDKDANINILYTGPSTHGDIPIFFRDWELTGAVFSLPGLREWQRPSQRLMHFHPATSYFNWSWDGAALIQEAQRSKVRYEGKALYIWKYDENRLIQVEKAFRAGSQLGAAPTPDLSIVPPAISLASIQIRGKSAIDSLNGGVGSPLHGVRTFPVTGGVITTCDGWAFDDLTQTAPEHVWLEFTNTENRKKYYWPAHRYSRPALSRGLKLSTHSTGISCEAVQYSLPVGTYTAKVYQIEGKAAIVSDFSTWTIPPTIIVR